MTFEFVFEPDPPQTGAVALEMQIKHDGEILEGATVQVEPWMPSHDHGSDTEAVVHEEGDGWYHVDELTFSMEGSWDLVFDIAEGDREWQVVLGVLVED